MNFVHLVWTNFVSGKYVLFKRRNFPMVRQEMSFRELRNFCEMMRSLGYHRLVSMASWPSGLTVSLGKETILSPPID